MFAPSWPTKMTGLSSSARKADHPQQNLNLSPPALQQSSLAFKGSNPLKMSTHRESDNYEIPTAAVLQPPTSKKPSRPPPPPPFPFTPQPHGLAKITPVVAGRSYCRAVVWQTTKNRTPLSYVLHVTHTAERKGTIGCKHGGPRKTINQQRRIRSHRAQARGARGKTTNSGEWYTPATVYV